MQECHSCGFRIIGLGCTKNNIRVTDHNTCGEWLPEDHPDTARGKEIAHTRRLDKDLPFGYIKLEYGEHNDTVEQFKKLVNRNTA